MQQPLLCANNYSDSTSSWKHRRAQPSQRRGVGEVAQAGLLWEQHGRLSVRLGVHRLGHVDLAKLNLQEVDSVTKLSTAGKHQRYSMPHAGVLQPSGS